MDFSVDKVAALAYLRLTDAEKKAFQAQFENILKYVDQLQQVPMTAEEGNQMGAFHVSLAFYEALKIDPSANLRNEDESNETEKLIFTNEEALKNAPQTGGIPGELLYEVPSIIER